MCKLKLSEFIGHNENYYFAKFYGSNILVQQDIASKLSDSHTKVNMLVFHRHLAYPGCPPEP